MRAPSRKFVEKTAFVLSLVLLAVAYGWVSGAQGWFPDAHLERAWRQADREVTERTGLPDFTNRRVYRGGGVLATEPEAMQPGLTLLVSTWEGFGWKPGLVLVDRVGRVLHQWRVDPGELFSESDYRRGANLAEQDLHGTHLFPNGDVIVNVEYAGAARLDACGDVEWRLNAGNHHSVERADDGTFWIPGVTGASPSRTRRYPDGFPGLEDGIHHGLLIQVDAEEPAVLRFVNALELLYDNGLERFIPKNRQHDRADVLHINDIEPLSAELAASYPLFQAGDLLVSLRNLDLVVVLDPESGRVKWHASEPFIMQHDPDWIGDGWIGVFDNNWDGTARGDMLGGSRIVALQPHTDSTRILFPTPESEPFYTARRGKWQLLENGNLLLTESSAGRVVEVAPDGRTLWEWIAGPYEETRVPSVARAQRVDLGPEDVAEWPCSSASRSAGG